MITELPNELVLYISRYLDPISLTRAITSNNIFAIDTSLRRVTLYKRNRAHGAVEMIRKYALYNICASLVQRVTKEVLDNLHL